MKCLATANRAGTLFRRRLTSRSEVKRSGRSQNCLHMQNALMEYLLLGRMA